MTASAPNAASLNPRIPDIDADAPALQRKNRSDGVWKSDHWWCNCEPRKKARILKVTKPSSPNKGRFYWKCAHHPFCNFFLWMDDARVREIALEPAPAPERPAARRRGPSYPSAATQKTPAFTQKSLAQFGFTNAANANHAAEQGAEDADADLDQAAADTGSGSSGAEEEQDASMAGGGRGAAVQRPSPPSGMKGKGKEALVTPGNANTGKRKRDAMVVDSDEFGSMDSDEERQLTELTDRTVRESAGKSAALGDDRVTPGQGSTMVGGLATPSVARTLFPQSESSKRPKTLNFRDTPSSKTMSPDAASHAGQNAAVATPNNASTTEDIAEEIMAVLEKQDLDSPTRDQVRALLKQASTRTRMIAMGRDAARSALRERDIKLGRMQERLADLENKQRIERERVARMKFGIMKVWDDN